MSKPTYFEVFDRMCKTDDQALKLAPLSGVISAQKTKRGTQILIGFGADVVTGLMRDEFVGGLLLVDRRRFEEVSAEMQEDAKQFPNFTEIAGQLHDQVHEACGLVATDGKDIGWAPEEGIPMIAQALREMFERGRWQGLPERA